MADTTNNNFFSNDLRIFYWNARRFMSRLEEIRKVLIDVDICICVETWLSKNTEEHKIQIPVFLAFRRDRLHTCGGGIIILIRENLNFTEIKNLKTPDAENVELYGIQITNLKKTLNLIVCYKPPNILISQEDFDNLLSNCNLIDNSLIVGDLNCHNQSWNCEKNCSNGSRLYNSIQKTNLFLHNTS